MRREILAWYEHYGRDLPWRAPRGKIADPYHVWLSEIMLQQTTVTTVKPYFLRFIEKWPTVMDLASADLDDILHGWQGLGYYARARNLHQCATIICGEFGGRFPEIEAELNKLPGIGVYTAAAISAIAFGNPANVVDGNVERVMARVYGLKEPLAKCKNEVRRFSAQMSPRTVRGRPGDFAQAVMDLGATICTPRKPKCKVCPWSRRCIAYQQGLQETLPSKQKKVPKPLRYGVAFWVLNQNGEIFMRKRPNRGLLGGMVEVPSTDWAIEQWSIADAIKIAPLKANWRILPGVVKHTFTHFHLELLILGANLRPVDGPAEAIWVLPEKIENYPLPTVIKKVVEHALK